MTDLQLQALTRF